MLLFLIKTNLGFANKQHPMKCVSEDSGISGCFTLFSVEICSLFNASRSSLSGF